MSVREITSKGQFDAILASGRLIYIDFYADWCGPCKAISPAFEQLAKDNAVDDVTEFYRVDIDGVSELAQALGIRSIPTFHAYKNSVRVDQLVGANRGALMTLVTKQL